MDFMANMRERERERKEEKEIEKRQGAERE